MKLKIHPLAYDDPLAGRGFYEMQQAGLGAYFLDTLFSDIESLLLHAGASAISAPYPGVSPMPSITNSMGK